MLAVAKIYETVGAGADVISGDFITSRIDCADTDARITERMYDQSFDLVIGRVDCDAPIASNILTIQFDHQLCRAAISSWAGTGLGVTIDSRAAIS